MERILTGAIVVILAIAIGIIGVLGEHTTEPPIGENTVTYYNVSSTSPGREAQGTARLVEFVAGSPVRAVLELEDGSLIVVPADRVAFVR